MNRHRARRSRGLARGRGTVYTAAMSHRVLVIEDDPDIQGYCNTVLESAGFTVDSTSTVEGARRLYGNRPDLIILDIGLPDGNGIDLMKEWQQYGATPPILF